MSLYTMHSRKSFLFTAENPTGAPNGGTRGKDCEKLNPCITIKSGETAVIADTDGPGMITHMWLSGLITHACILRIFWEGETFPSVEAPIPAFFGRAYDESVVDTEGKYVTLNSALILTAPANGYNCYFEMPFLRHCRITVENRGDSDQLLFYAVTGWHGETDPHAGYFHAFYRQEHPVQKGRAYTVADGIKGKGTFVGVTLAAGMNGNNTCWVEGEAKMYLDGDTYPTVNYTGLEDYFCGSFAFGNDYCRNQYQPYQGLYAGLQAVIGNDNAAQYNGQQRFLLYRFHVKDPIYFDEGFRMTIDSLGWAGPRYDDFTTVAYWYLDHPAPLPEELPSHKDMDMRYETPDTACILKKEPSMPTAFDPSAVPLLLDWYRAGHRDLPWRHTKDPYHIWISEIMLQQTRAETVVPYYHRFLDALPAVRDLAAADEPTLYKLWEGLGYYSRARNLKRAAEAVVERYGGILPADFEALLTLPGVGRYTAGAVASIAFDIPVPAVDGNVLRVMARLLGDDTDILSPAAKTAAEEMLAPHVPSPGAGDFTQSLIELGATVCIPAGAPRCAECPLRLFCTAAREGRQNELPVRIPKARRKTEARTVLVIHAPDGRVALRRRPDKGLLAGLYEFPCLDGHADEASISAYLADLGLCPAAIISLPPAKHIFTHLEWLMQGFSVTLAEPPQGAVFDWLFAAPAELDAAYAIPSAYAAYRPYALG